MTTKTETFVTVEQFETLITRVNELEQKITELTTPKPKTQKEMTDNDAKRILTGDLKGNTHNECVKITNLSYGQIYSCRLGHTFRHIHKLLQAEGFTNPWIK